ncbi:MAG: hypothetical protein ACXV8G_02955 [Acidimicrobiales bacterium]
MPESAAGRRDQRDAGGISRPIGAALLLAAVVLPLLRQRGTPSWDSIWAEDGAIYAGPAIRDGGLSVLLRGYAGYLQLPPRLIALVIPLVPIRELALFTAVAGSVVNALLAWFVYRQSRGWIPTPLLRLALASSIVLGPVLLGENTANITNTIWSFAAVAPLAIGSMEERPASIVARSAVAFLAATSTALSFLFLPLALVVVVTRRSRATLVVLGSFAVGLVLQAFVTLNSPGLRTFSNEVTDLVRGLGIRVFWFSMIGVRITTWIGSSPPLGFAVAGAVVLGGLFVLMARGSSRRARLAALVLGVTAVLVFVVPLWVRGTLILAEAEGFAATQRYQRYSVIPIFLLLAAAMVLLDDPSRTPVRWVRVAKIVLVAQILLLVAVDFSGSNGRSYLDEGKPYPRWTELVDTAWNKCDRQPSDREIDIPASFFFSVTVTCSDLAP